MLEKNIKIPEAKGGVAIICFLIVIIGQGYLLRNVLFTSPFSSWPSAYHLELFFCIILLAGITICFIRPTGWGLKAGRLAALGLFVIYTVFTIFNYDTFMSGYLTGFHAEFESAGGALVGLKLVLTLIGVTAGIPAGPRIDEREYAHRLREKVQMQQAEWAKASVKGAQKDLETTLEQLKQTLSDEEMAALLTQLQETAQNKTNTHSSQNSKTPSSSVSEDWKGWGGGM